MLLKGKVVLHSSKHALVPALLERVAVIKLKMSEFLKIKKIKFIILNIKYLVFVVDSIEYRLKKI